MAPAAWAGPSHIAAELVAESAARPGETVLLALHMRPEPGWHGYWQNPGDAGLGITLDWTLPKGASAGALQYPVPTTLLLSGLMNHVYERDYAVLVPMPLPAEAAPGTELPLRAHAEWLACTDKICVPESAELTGTVAVGAPGPRDPRFDGWQAALPAPLGARASFALAGGKVRLGIPLPASVRLEAPHLFMASEHVADYAAPQAFSRQSDMLIVELERAKFAAIEPATITALLRLDRAGNGVTVEAAPGTVPPAGEPLADHAPTAGPDLPFLLLSALLGGLLLNVMPCVFPILSLKALSLARAGESQAQARAEGLAYTAGVVLACLALGVLLLGLRAAGQEVGWAFQLQEPLVVAALLLLAVAITANLLGVFELSIPGFAQAGSPQGAFATGLLAAFVATPCTGPFMAAAMGAALLLPAPQALALFAALGLGIALPFLAIAEVPALRRMLPRPGAWMTRFRTIMALPMALTAAALVWLASRVAGSAFAFAAVLIAIVLVAILVLLGRRQRHGLAGGAIVHL
ncbi:MAG TPA: protein-disulfide reductase DsbD family protein, partial [Novosphingobium sp.]|nr:protein-disulfide reductase DsbD family protein [Novosphingobium sp.]